MTETAAFDAAVAELGATEDAYLFHGEKIQVRELCSIVYLKFCKATSLGAGTGDAEGAAAIWDVIEDVVLPESRTRFLDLAKEHRDTTGDLLEFVKKAIEVVAGRPTKPLASLAKSASDGSPKSKSESRVIDLGDGRIVEMQPGETTAAATARALRMEIDETPEAIQMVAVELHE